MKVRDIQVGNIYKINDISLALSDDKWLPLKPGAATKKFVNTPLRILNTKLHVTPGAKPKRMYCMEQTVSDTKRLHRVWVPAEAIEVYDVRLTLTARQYEIYTLIQNEISTVIEHLRFKLGTTVPKVTTDQTDGTWTLNVEFGLEVVMAPALTRDGAIDWKNPGIEVSIYHDVVDFLMNANGNNQFVVADAKSAIEQIKALWAQTRQELDKQTAFLNILEN